MQNQDHFREGPRLPGGKLKEFFSWLRKLFEPKYIPQKVRYGNRDQKTVLKNSVSDAQSNNEKGTGDLNR